MGQLRDYNLRIPAGGSISAEVDGDFFMVRSCKNYSTASPTLYTASSDLVLTLEFDDSGKISRRAGEGGKRQFKRVTFSVADDGLGNQGLGANIIVTLGYGELYSEREDMAVSNTAEFATFTMASNASSPITGAGIHYMYRELRLNVPATEAGGVWLSSNPVFNAANAVWLEKGVTEYMAYTGLLYAHNRNGAPATINVGYLLRNDF